MKSINKAKRFAGYPKTRLRRRLAALPCQSAQCAVRTDAWGAAEQVTLNQIETTVLGDTIDSYVGKYFEAGKATEAIGKRLLFQNYKLALIAPLFETKRMSAVVDQFLRSEYSGPCPRMIVSLRPSQDSRVQPCAGGNGSKEFRNLHGVEHRSW